MPTRNKAVFAISLSVLRCTFEPESWIGSEPHHACPCKSPLSPATPIKQDDEARSCPNDIEPLRRFSMARCLVALCHNNRPIEVSVSEDNVRTLKYRRRTFDRHPTCTTEISAMRLGPWRGGLPLLDVKGADVVLARLLYGKGRDSAAALGTGGAEHIEHRQSHLQQCCRRGHVMGSLVLLLATRLATATIYSVTA